MTVRRGRTDVQERISDFSIWAAVVGILLGGLFILAMLVGVLLLNSQTLPQSPIILGPPR